MLPNVIMRMNQSALCSLVSRQVKSLSSINCTRKNAKGGRSSGFAPIVCADRVGMFRSVRGGICMEIIHLNDEFIKLGQALKVANLADSGAEAKIMVQDGLVRVNGETEVRRGKKLVAGDIVEYNGKTVKIEA